MDIKYMENKYIKMTHGDLIIKVKFYKLKNNNGEENGID